MGAINKTEGNGLNGNIWDAFFDATDIAIVFVDKQYNITQANEAFTRLTGFETKDWKEKHFIDLVGEADKAQVIKVFDQLKPAEKQIVECLLQRKDGSSTILAFTLIRFPEAAELPLGFAVQINPCTVARPIVDLENTISKFSTLIDNSRDVLYSLYYKDFKFEYLSPSVVDLTGFTRDELMNMTPRQMLQIIHSDYRRMYLRYWNSIKLHTNRPNYTVEYKVRPKLGISRWLSDNHKVILDDNGEILKLVGNIRDITDFKLVEEALNRSRDRLFKAIEATNDGMWDWKISAGKIYFDARFYTMLGYEPLEFPAAIDEWVKRIHPDDIESVKSLLNTHLEGKSEQWMIEYRFQAKNGSWIWILNKGKVFERGDNGEPLRMVGTHSDISLRKKAEEELQKRNTELETIYEQLQFSEEKFRQLAENTQDVFWLRDQESIIYINPSFDKVWGRSREEVIQNPSALKDWVHPEDHYQFEAWLNFSSFEIQKSYIEQYRILKPNGDIRWIWSRMFPVYNEKNQIYRLAGIASDITDQKSVEEALISAKEKAMESDQLKSAFLANISHEIRTPMNGIIGFAELLKDDALSVDSRIQYVNVITKSSEQLLHIIDDIIDISKIEANQVNINSTNIRIASLLADLQLFYENEKTNVGKNDIELSAEISPLLIDTVISTDESRLRQVLMNLISNALKFTEKGYVKFGFLIRQDSFVEFYVTDSGTGIPKDRQSLIFKRFRQLDDTFTRKFGGTGLGLAICEGLVKLLGGQIWVNSEVNKGSTFSFTIPSSSKVNKTMAGRKDTFINSVDFDWSGKTIMIVEDDEINMEFLIAVLTPTKAVLLNAVSGEEAVSLSETNHTIDLILMDIRLPKMDGYEAFDKIRKKRPSLPVIAQTAFAMTEDAARCLEFGFADYISKPINRKNLLAMVNRIFGQKSNNVKNK